MKIMIKGARLIWGVALCFTLGSVSPMSQKLTQLKDSLTELQRKLSQLSASLGALKSKLGAGKGDADAERRLREQEAERKRLEAAEIARRAEEVAEQKARREKAEEERRLAEEEARRALETPTPAVASNELVELINASIPLPKKLAEKKPIETLHQQLQDTLAPFVTIDDAALKELFNKPEENKNLLDEAVKTLGTLTEEQSNTLSQNSPRFAAVKLMLEKYKPVGPRPGKGSVRGVFKEQQKEGGTPDIVRKGTTWVRPEAKKTSTTGTATGAASASKAAEEAAEKAAKGELAVLIDKICSDFAPLRKEALQQLVKLVNIKIGNSDEAASMGQTLLTQQLTPLLTADVGILRQYLEQPENFQGIITRTLKILSDSDNGALLTNLNVKNLKDNLEVYMKLRVKINPNLNKIDLLEIPKFEDFYQSFKANYLNDKIADSKFGKARNSFNYTKETIDDVIEYIGRAYFEKYILDLCKKYIEANDANRSKSGQNQNWVNAQYLGAIITSVENRTEGADIKFLLNDIAGKVAFAVDDMFYYKENGDSANCGCLTTALNAVNSVSNNNILSKPIAYLIYEAMHVTLGHNFMLLSSLANLFDFSEKDQADVSVKGKMIFRIGFDDEVFSKTMSCILEKEKDIRNSLRIKFQVASGSNFEFDTGYKILAPDGNIVNEKGPRLVITVGYNPTPEQLLYGIKYHIDRHSCYSVGLIPYDFVQMLKIENEEIKDKVIEINADAQINQKEATRLRKGLARVPRIVDYLVEGCKPISPESVGGRTKFVSLFKELPKNLPPITLGKITEKEWEEVFSLIAQDPDYKEKIEPLFVNKEVKEALERNITEEIGQEFAKAGPKQPVRLVVDAIYEAFNKANK